MADDRIRVPVDADHPLGSGEGVEYGSPEKMVTGGQKVGLVLFVVGVALLGVVAFNLNFNLGLSYLAFLCLVFGVALSYQASNEGS